MAEQWKPKKGEKYYRVHADLVNDYICIVEAEYVYGSCFKKIDAEKLEKGNCFKTAEEAENHCKQVLEQLGWLD